MPTPTLKRIGPTDREYAKERSGNVIVRVLTTAAEIPIGYLVRQEPNFIRVAHFEGFERHVDLNEPAIRWRGKWVVDEIDTRDIRQCVKLSAGAGTGTPPFPPAVSGGKPLFLRAA